MPRLHVFNLHASSFRPVSAAAHSGSAADLTASLVSCMHVGLLLAAARPLLCCFCGRGRCMMSLVRMEIPFWVAWRGLCWDMQQAYVHHQSCE